MVRLWAVHEHGSYVKYHHYYCRVQNTIKDYENKELQGARIRAKVEEIEQGERCTSYFVKLERQKAKHKMMTTLITDNETLINKQDDILNETAEFRKTFIQTIHLKTLY